MKTEEQKLKAELNEARIIIAVLVGKLNALKGQLDETCLLDAVKAQAFLSKGEKWLG